MDQNLMYSVMTKDGIAARRLVTINKFKKFVNDFKRFPDSTSDNLEENAMARWYERMIKENFYIYE